MEKKTKNIIVSALTIIAYIAFIIVSWYFISSLLADKETVRATISHFGWLAPIIFILIQITQNVIAPIAHYPVLIAGGYIFGATKGFFYNWIGTVIGTTLIILLTKRFGRPLVEKFVSKKFMLKYDSIVQKLSPYGLFLVYFLPAFPDDEITYMIGLSNMPPKEIFIAIIFGKMGGATLSIIGDDPVNGIMPMLILNAVMIIAISAFYFRKNIVNIIRSGRWRRGTKNARHMKQHSRKSRDI